MEEIRKELSQNELDKISGGAKKPGKYRCTRPGCSFTYEGHNPPRRCPLCGGLVARVTGTVPEIELDP